MLNPHCLCSPTYKLITALVPSNIVSHTEWGQSMLWEVYWKAIEKLELIIVLKPRKVYRDIAITQYKTLRGWPWGIFNLPSPKAFHVMFYNMPF